MGGGGVEGGGGSPPDPPPNEIVSTSTPSRLSTSCCTCNPSSSVRFPCLAASSRGNVLACRLWLTFKIKRADSEKGGETNSATRDSLATSSRAGSVPCG